MRLIILYTIAVVALSLNSTPTTHAQNYVSRDELLQIKQDMQQLRELTKEMQTKIKQQNKMINNLKEELITKTSSSADSDALSGANPEKNKDPDLHDILSSIKPAVSVTGDFVANFSDDKHIQSEAKRFDLRDVSIAFSGEIDDVATAKFFLSYHDDDVNLEEGFLDVHDILPFGTDLKLGKFRVDFGLLNTTHLHGLPQVDYPAVYRTYLGHHGYIDEGVGISGKLPSLWNTPFEYSLQVLNGNRHSDDNDNDKDQDTEEYSRLKDYDNLAFAAKINNSFILTDKLGIKWGLSALTGKFEDDDESPRHYLTGADLTFFWGTPKHPLIRWQTEIFSSQIEDNSNWERSYGLYSFIEFRLSSKWLVGTRYDYAQMPFDSEDRLTEYSGYLTHSYSKNNQIRLQLKSSQRNFEKDTNEIFLQWIFTLGQHGHDEK